MKVQDLFEKYELREEIVNSIIGIGVDVLIVENEKKIAETTNQEFAEHLKAETEILKQISFECFKNVVNSLISIGREN